MAVRTKSGLVTGLVEDGIEVFRGIPYGASTALSGRFRPPASPEPWGGERPCRNLGFACPQPELALAGLAVGTEREPSSEDCLVVNVYTPGADSSRRPVMFWFHGGAWTMGSGGSPGYDGRRLARRGDVVVVTVNHRLGYLGFHIWPTWAATPTLIRATSARLTWWRRCSGCTTTSNLSAAIPTT